MEEPCAFMPVAREETLAIGPEGIKRIASFVGLASVVYNQFWIGDFQVKGLEYLPDPSSSPVLWVGNHVKWHDFPAFFSLHGTVPSHPPVKAVGRKGYSPLFAKAVDDFVLRHLLVQMYRPNLDLGKGKISPKEAERQSHLNRVKVQFARDSLRSGFDVGILPQGTTRKDGSEIKVYPGVGKIVEDSSVRVFPFAVTYDDMTGPLRGLHCKGFQLGQRADICSVRFGESFTYDSVEGDFLDYVRKTLNGLHTVTAKGILSFVLMEHMNRFHREVRISTDELKSVLERTVPIFKDFPGIDLEERLSSERGIVQAAKNYFQELCVDGYVCPDSKVDRQRLFTPAEYGLYHRRGFRGGNRVLYGANEFRCFLGDQPLLGKKIKELHTKQFA